MKICRKKGYMNAYETKLHHQMNEELKRKGMRINLDGPKPKNIVFFI